MDTVYFTQEWVSSPLSANGTVSGPILDLKLKDQPSLNLPNVVEAVIDGETDWSDLIKKNKPSHILYRAVDLSSLSSAIRSSVYQTLELVKALRGMAVRMIFLSTRPHPVMGALSGICKTCVLESKRHVFSVLTLESLDEDLILKEFSGTDVEVRYQTGQRQVKKNTEVVYRSQDTAIRNGGTYLITGGTGGLGLIFAHYLMKKYNANVLLVGRRKLEKNIGEAKYYVCDISSEEAVKELAVQLSREGIKVNGILHCAGTNRDNFILKKSFAELDMVVPPKTFGVNYLMTHFPPVQMDFFLLFSSTAAAFGNAGQFDYSYANCYLDALPQSGRKVRSFNWPLWRDGGMHVDAETEKFMERSMGLVPMDTETGLAAFEFSLAGPHKNLGVITGHADKMKTTLGIVPLSGAPDIETFLGLPEGEWKEMALQLTGAQRSQLIQKITAKLN